MLESNKFTVEQAETLKGLARQGLSYPVIQDRLRAAYPDAEIRFYFPGPVSK